MNSCAKKWRNHVSKKLRPNEVVEAIQVLTTTIRLLHEEAGLAAIILTHDAFDTLRRHFGPMCERYEPGVIVDPGMENGFVVKGLIILRGTQLQ